MIYKKHTVDVGDSDMKTKIGLVLAAAILAMAITACADNHDDRYAIWSPDWNPVLDSSR